MTDHSKRWCDLGDVEGGELTGKSDKDAIMTEVETDWNRDLFGMRRRHLFLPLFHQGTVVRTDFKNISFP